MGSFSHQTTWSLPLKGPRCLTPFWLDTSICQSSPLFPLMHCFNVSGMTMASTFAVANQFLDPVGRLDFWQLMDPQMTHFQLIEMLRSISCCIIRNDFYISTANSQKNGLYGFSVPGRAGQSCGNYNKTYKWRPSFCPCMHWERTSNGKHPYLIICVLKTNS